MSPFISRRAGVILGNAWPILVAQLVSVGMMVADTIIVGRFSTEHLAAVSVGSGIYVVVAMSLGGILQALIPIIGQHFGAGENDQIGFEFRQGLWLALFLSLFGATLLASPHWMLAFADLKPEVESIAVHYMQILALALPTSIVYRAFHATTTALGQPRPLMVIATLETVAHFLLAFCLVGGHLGLPTLGAAGAALSQAIVGWLNLALCMVVLLNRRRFGKFRIFSRFERPNRAAQWRILRLGLPTGTSFCVEISAFTLMAIFIARIDEQTLSGHRIAATLSASLYMLPLALALSTASAVAQSVGARNEALARAYTFTGIKIAASFALIVAFLLLCLRAPIVGLATTDPAVFAVAVTLTFYIAIYQVFDAIQTVACFALRAYKIAFLPLVIHVTCFWGMGLLLGYCLAFRVTPPQGASGFWQGAVASTLTGCVLFGGLLWWVYRTRARDYSVEGNTDVA